jgi:hypothetical protein
VLPGITRGPSDDMVLALDAPVLHVRGIAYKGSIETTSRPPARPQLARAGPGPV